jgi:uncharacterized protein with HEPN domain
MSRTYIDYLRDILEASTNAIAFLDGVKFAEFDDNIEKQYAVTRALAIIGEAARHIPQSVRVSYPQLPWKEMVGMRNIVAHEYFGVDNNVIWRTVKEDLPSLQAAVQTLLET